MLYLTRKIGEKIVINGDIEIQIIDIKGKTAKLGFSFPPGISILRKEIQEKIIIENQNATQAKGDDFLDAIKDLGLDS